MRQDPPHLRVLSFDTMTSKNNGLSAALVSNLQDVLSKRKGGSDGSAEEEEPPPSTSVSVDVAAKEEIDDSRPIVLVTNGDGIDSIGLVSLVEALVKEGLYNVHVCAPQTVKSVSSHSMTPGETIAASSADIKGATAFEVSGTTVDCISLGLSGALFAWSKPILVISGINQGSSCGHQMFYSGAVAGAREALISGVPSLSISLNWKKDESKESDFKDAVGGFKVTKQSMWRQTPSWQAVSANRHPGAGNFMVKSVSSHSMTPGETIAASSADIKGATAFEIFPFECIANLKSKYRLPVRGAVNTCPRMCKMEFRKTGEKGFSLNGIYRSLGTDKNNGLSAALVSNLQDVLSKRKGGSDGSAEEEEPPPSTSVSVDVAAKEEIDDSRPIVLVTNGDGIDSIGLVSLVEALVKEGLYNVHVCAPQTDKSASSHSMTPGETIAASSAGIKGATAFEVSGTPVDCISLGLSGALFAWSKPILIISGINQGSSCGHQMFYSGGVAGAREALISGVPSLCLSLNWKKDESKESDFKDAVGVTKQSMWRQTPSCQAVSANRHPGAGNFMSNQQSLGAQLAQLGRDASAAGAARRFTTQKKSIVEIESVGVAAKTDSRVKKYFRLEFVGKEQEEHTDEDLDIKALEDGFVSVTPLSLLPKMDSETQAAASEWISKALNADQ
ncbi:hypothetical protein HID58_005877 [Brassica napus]|uniref:Survival protein SurE-like phosphatase/nucleotidase domain-containing protein n=2 Tax=Brassica TaxID=3705 RepID=A0ABQ8E9S6_BRANA|nr:hypothetical protein HID58_005877 [Brassica napus]